MELNERKTKNVVGAAQPAENGWAETVNPYVQSKFEKK